MVLRSLFQWISDSFKTHEAEKLLKSRKWRAITALATCAREWISSRIISLSTSFARSRSTFLEYSLRREVNLFALANGRASCSNERISCCSSLQSLISFGGLEEDFCSFSSRVGSSSTLSMPSIILVPIAPFFLLLPDQYSRRNRYHYSVLPLFFLDRGCLPSFSKLYKLSRSQTKMKMMNQSGILKMKFSHRLVRVERSDRPPAALYFLFRRNALASSAVLTLTDGDEKFGDCKLDILSSASIYNNRIFSENLKW